MDKVIYQKQDKKQIHKNVGKLKEDLEMKKEDFHNLSKIYELLENGSPDKEFMEKAERINKALSENLEETIRADREYRIGVAKANRNTLLG
jgi:hypothetical protein